MQKSFLHTEQLCIGHKTDKPLYTTPALSLKPKSFTLIAGRNGCGKSTLLLSLAGLHKTLAGTVFYMGLPIEKIPVSERAALFSMVFTGRIRNQYLKVVDVLNLASQTPAYPFTRDQKNEQRYKKAKNATPKNTDNNASLKLPNPQSTSKTKTEEIAERCHIEHLFYNSINHLSDGEYQRVMIARALVQDTPLIMLDEPVAHLDPVAQQKTFQLLRELVDLDGKMILAASHAFDSAFQHADEFWLIDMKNECAVLRRENAVKEVLMPKLYGEF